jgi:two-component system sensor histidine kinase BaeS
MRLKYQLFLTLLLSSILLIALMAAFNSWSFNRGFSNFVIENETQRLTPLIAELETAYSKQQSWDWIRKNPESAKALFREHHRGRTGPRGSDRKRQSDRKRPPLGLYLRDADKVMLLGPESVPKSTIWHPITYNDSTVAYLGFREPKGLPGGIENVFAAQQLRSYAYAAAGEYDHRIDEAGRDEIGDLSRNINQLALTLEKNLSARQQWTAEISHELRTPVAILQGELEALQDGVAELDDSAIASLHAESLRLSRLIDDLHELSLSDLGALNYKMDELDIVALTQQRLHESKSLCSQYGLSIACESEQDTLIINGDKQRLVQLIDNLLQNSLRYTAKGGAINIRLRGSDDSVVVVWEDTAPGVTEAELPHLFDSLYRAEDSRSREHGGSGLGLAVVAKIVEAHSGKIEAYHSPTGGLGLRMWLPKLSQSG